jgi:PAS domain S-box-containing protein
MKIHEINTEDPAAVAEDMRSASLAQRNTFLFEHRLASGERRTVEVSSTLVEFGGRDLLFSIIQDVTAREEARAALVRERQRYRSFMDIAQDGIHLLDKDGNLIEANRSFLRMIGATEAAVGRLNVHDWDVGIPRDKLGARVKELIEQPGLFETRHRHTEGTVIDVEVHAGAIELDGERFQLASSRDITPRKLVEKELAVKQLQLEELNRSLEARIQRAVDELRAKDQILITQNRHAAMGEVIGNVAHQWRQPLHTLAMLIANVRDASRAGELDAAAIERAASDATRLLQRMSSTINDFRDFLMPDKERRPFSVVKQVNDAVRLLDATFGDAGIRVDVAAPEDATVFGYANEYSQVVVNLLTNARQAIQSTRKEHGCVSIQLSSDASEAVLTVRDNGGGVPGDLLDRIFEPYFSTKLGGTGLGLYMSRGLVERNLGGILEARNVDGGAEFLIRTPIARPQPGAVGRRDSRRPAAAPARPRKRARQRGPLE